MAEDLMAGYAAYTSAEEFGADANGEAPGTIIVITAALSAASVSAVSGYVTTEAHC